MIGLDGLSLGGCGQISVSRSCAVANPTAVPFIGDSVQSMPANHPRDSPPCVGSRYYRDAASCQSFTSGRQMCACADVILSVDGRWAV